MLDPVILIVVVPTAIIAFVITDVVVRALAKSPEIREKIVIPIIVSKWLLGVLWGRT